MRLPAREINILPLLLLSDDPSFRGQLERVIFPYDVFKVKVAGASDTIHKDRQMRTSTGHLSSILWASLLVVCLTTGREEFLPSGTL